jgi:hypothetical protein
MMIQCAACHASFEMPPAALDDRTEAPPGEPLCNDCLLAHIERLVSGKSCEWDHEGGFIEESDCRRRRQEAGGRIQKTEDRRQKTEERGQWTVVRCQRGLWPH